jgi:hypothetical protein
VEERTLYCLDMRRHYPAHFYIHHLVLQNPIPLIAEKGIVP